MDFAFKIPPVFTPLKSLKSYLDATRLQENTPKIQNFPGEHAPGPLLAYSVPTARDVPLARFTKIPLPPTLINTFLRLCETY